DGETSVSIDVENRQSIKDSLPRDLISLGLEELGRPTSQLQLPYLCREKSVETVVSL
ncbi:Hypothetical predicted protein, partial [Paramuricea clavata]